MAEAEAALPGGPALIVGLRYTFIRLTFRRH